MAANNANILSGVGSTTSIGSLAYFAAGDTAGPTGVAFTAEVQTLTITGSPTGGTMTLVWNGLSSAPVTVGASLPTTASLQSTLISAWGLTGLTVTGTPGTSYVITYPASRGNVALPTVTTAFTGGTSPTAAIVETTPGAGSTPATAAIPAGFVDAGWITTDGLTANVSESSSNVQGYGSTQTLRVLISQSSRSFDMAFLETNATSQAVYSRQAIGSVTPDSGGNFSIPIGPPNLTTYAGIFDMVDGFNHVRLYCPRLQVSTIKSWQIQAGKEITWPVTMTALPDTSGNSVYQYFLVNALAH